MNISGEYWIMEIIPWYLFSKRNNYLKVISTCTSITKQTLNWISFQFPVWFQPGNNLNKASKYLYCILLVNGVYIYYANYATDIHNKLDYKEFEFTGTFISIELIYIVGHLYVFTYCTYFPFISFGKNLH